jgi:hypothetical protein
MRGFVLAALVAASPAAAEEYTVLMAGNRAGSETVTKSGEGVQSTFEFNDRGRGPRLVSRIRLAADGTIVSLDTEGNDYLKTPVSEHFSITGDRARWKNKGEAGERAVQGPALYVSFDSVPAETGLIAQALLKAPGHRLALLPEGEARIEQVGELEVKAGDRTRKIVHYEISGFDFQPSPVWLDADGSFFGNVSTFFSILPAGWEGVASELLAAQDRADEGRGLAIAKRAVRHPKALVVRHVALFDAAGARVVPDSAVVVVGDRITSVGPDAKVSAPSGAEVVEGRGKTLLPGLWDMHVHVSPNDGPLNIAAGVTTVRDLANDTDALARLRQAWDEERAVGPRVIAAGFIDCRGPYQGPTKVFADTVEEGLADIARYAELGYPQIKLYSSLKPELVKPLAAEAHRRGMRVSGHIPAFMTAAQAVEDGYDEIQHINMLFLNFWADDVKDTRTPARFTAVAERAADLDLDSAPVRTFFAQLKQHGTVSDPTVAIFEGMFTDRSGQMSRSYAAIADRLPPSIRRGFLGGGLPVPEGKDQRYRDSFAKLLQMIQRLDAAGIPIVAGTDGLAGFTLHRELELYVEAGLSPAHVLQIATLGAARVMRKDSERGSISAGKQADLLLVDGDPVSRISDIRKASLVVKNGAVYSPAVLYEALGVKP